MTQVNGSYSASPVYNNQPTGRAQPVTYVPGAGQAYGTDQFRTQNQTQSGGLGGLLGGGNNKPYVTRQTVMLTAGAAVAGFMIAGPIGAIIGGIIALLAGIFMNVKNMKAQEQQAKMGQPQGQIPAQGYQQYTGANQNMSAQQQQQLQQQQLQQQQAQQQAAYQARMNQK